MYSISRSFNRIGGIELTKDIVLPTVMFLGSALWPDASPLPATFATDSSVIVPELVSGLADFHANSSHSAKLGNCGTIEGTAENP